jgi:hypothetical protein
MKVAALLVVSAFVTGTFNVTTASTDSLAQNLWWHVAVGVGIVGVMVGVGIVGIVVGVCMVWAGVLPSPTCADGNEKQVSPRLVVARAQASDSTSFGQMQASSGPTFELPSPAHAE